MAADAPEPLPRGGHLPTDDQGQPLNFDFEAGNLRDWQATGKAFDKQPVEGDKVHARRQDMRSDHLGNFWVGTFEVGGDAPQGTLTSRPFRITRPWASFLVAGGSQLSTRVELVRADLAKVIYHTTVPKGFHVSLFAAEPDVTQPIAQAIDDRGRLWVAEAYSYPRRVEPDKARDRLLIFEDTDGDGHFDTRKVFADKLNLISGFEIGFGGVWVGAAPEFLFIPDANGDDVPDGPPQVLLDGWGYQDTHETLNTFMWGPDGWLYGCHGVFTHSQVGKPGTPDDQRVRINAGIWRYHPTKHLFEVFAEGTSNPWGIDFNDQGEAFITACVIPHLYQMIQGGRYQRQAGQHFNKYTYDDIKTIALHRHWIGATPHSGNNRSDAAGGGHAHAGAMIYLGGVWPAEYRGKLVMNNIHGARLNVDQLAPQGSGYVGDRSPDFLFANDSWSQIINLQSGPDGQMYMIDWYDRNQCHHFNIDGHDRSNGRVFKVSYGGAKATPVDVKKLDDRGLVEAQLNPNDWHVRHARRVIQERGLHDAGALTRLKEIAFTHADSTRRLRGLWALHAAGLIDEDLIARGLANDDPYVRAWTVQLACEDRHPSQQTLDKFAELAQRDPSPVVRCISRRLPFALRTMPGGRSVQR